MKAEGRRERRGGDLNEDRRPKPAMAVTPPVTFSRLTGR
jgi:hypothetical protein